MNRAVFLDRDGVINRNPPDGEYVKEAVELSMLPDVDKAVSKLKQMGYKIIVITNQRGVARGLVSEENLNSMHKEIQTKLNNSIDAFYYCPHDLNLCDCRKPLPGMILKASQDLGVDLNLSWLIGDRESDRQTGIAAGIPEDRVILMKPNGRLLDVLDKIGQ